MRLLACPIFGNQHPVPGAERHKTPGKQGKPKLRKDQYGTVKQEVEAIYFSLIR